MDRASHNDDNNNSQKQHASHEAIHEPIPFVIRHGKQALKTWNCLSWTLEDWAQKCQNETKFKFRVHKRSNKISSNYDIHTISMDSQFEELNWENKATDYIEATMSQLVEYIREQQDDEAKRQSNSNSPFKKYPLDQYCLYSAYNYMDQVLDPETRRILNQTIKWKDIGLGLNQDDDHSIDSTIWIGTTGSYTPCHQDTYGYNFVAQLYGKKLWILFPPSDSENLYPTRIPYEESSIFSQIDFKAIDIRKYPRFTHSRPYIVELIPGDLLYVPHHWWHYVENVSDSNHIVSISVNTWIDHTRDSSRDHLNECVVQLLFNSLFQSLGFDHKWLNLNVELLSAEELMQTLIHLVQNHTSINPNCIYKKPMELEVEYLKESKLEDLFGIKSIKAGDDNINLQQQKQKNIQKQTLTMKDVVNSILHPDVIDLIVTKLLSKQF